MHIPHNMKPEYTMDASQKHKHIDLKDSQHKIFVIGQTNKKKVIITKGQDMQKQYVFTYLKTHIIRATNCLIQNM